MRKTICVGLAICLSLYMNPVTTIFAKSNDTYVKKEVVNFSALGVPVVQATEENKLQVESSEDNEILFEATFVEEVYHVVSENGVYVRSAPSVDSEAYIALPYNAEITVIGIAEDVDWAIIKYEDKNAYIAKQYIEVGAAPLEEETTLIIENDWTGSVLTAVGGVNYGPSGKETWYDLDMSNIVVMMEEYGYSASDYQVRSDGVKTLGGYVMVAADLNKYPRGSLVKTSLGIGLVCDTGDFVYNGSGVAFDIACDWN